MAKIRYSLLMILLSLQVLGLYANTNLFTRHDLIKYLTNKHEYDPDYPPGFYEGVRNTVTVQLEVVDLMSINEQNMEYSATMIVRMQWKDYRLNFSEPASFDHLVLTGDMVKLVWRPDLFISNERKTVSHTLLRYEEMAYIYPTGEVQFSLRISMTNFCQMDMRNYPFDVQHCEIVIQSYAFTADMMLLKWFKHAVQFKSLELPNYSISVEKHSSHSSSNEIGSLISGTFSYLKVNIKFERKSSAYSSTYFAPYPLFFMIAMSSFAFKDQISSRISLCTAGMTTSVLQWIAIYTRLPHVWYLTYLDGWILAHVILIGLILVYHAFWYMCLHQAHKEQDQIDDDQFVKKNVNDLPDLEGFLSSISDDKRFKIISTRKREEYFKGYVDRLKRNKFLKAIRKKPLDFSVFLFFIVVYTTMLQVLFVFWAAEDDISKKYLWFLLIEFIFGGGLISLIISKLCKGTCMKADNAIRCCCPSRILSRKGSYKQSTTDIIEMELLPKASSVTHIPCDVEPVKKDHDQHTLETKLEEFAGKVVQQGFKLLDDTPADGNCFFWAVSSQLLRVKQVQMSHIDLRTEVVNFLKELPEDDKSEIARSLTTSFDTFLENNSHEGTYADNVIVQAMSDRLDIFIHIIHANRNYNRRITPKNLTQSTAITVGYLDNAEHYVSLERIQPQDVVEVKLKEGRKEKTYAAKVLQIDTDTDIAQLQIFKTFQKGIYTWLCVEEISWQPFNHIIRIMETLSFIFEPSKQPEQDDMNSSLMSGQKESPQSNGADVSSTDKSSEQVRRVC